MPRVTEPAADVDALLSAIVERTGTLRAAPADAAARAEERRLLDDLRRVAAVLRAEATAHGDALRRALDAIAPDAAGSTGDPRDGRLS